MPKPVLFLDIDGVLNNVDDMRLGVHLDPRKVLLLNALDCEIVISSTWRKDHPIKTLAAMLWRAGLRRAVIGRTPIEREMRSAYRPRAGRGCEIAQWLASNPGRAFAIVDDDSDFLPEQLPHFVQTYFSTGLTATHVAMIASIINRSAPAGGAQEPCHARRP